jgi:hypothetical protein
LASASSLLRGWRSAAEKEFTSQSWNWKGGGPSALASSTNQGRALSAGYRSATPLIFRAAFYSAPLSVSKHLLAPVDIKNPESMHPILKHPFRAFSLTISLGFCAVLSTQAIEPKSPPNTSIPLVAPQSATPVDRYAMEKLSLYLERITGAQFPVAEPQENGAGTRAIYVGTSEPVIAALGSDPLNGLKDQEHIARSLGGDIFLYGKGPHGNLYAVVDFLENSIGWRWYSLFEFPVLPQQLTIALEPFERRRGFSFSYRTFDLQRSRDFPYLHGANLGFDKLLHLRAKARGDSLPKRSERRFVSALHEVNQGSGGHSFFSFIPPNPAAPASKQFEWLEKKDYFRTNPEFFSMDENGDRVSTRQLNFGNPELRQELTKNILRLIEIEGDDIVVELGMMDVGGRLCHSPESQALEEKYQTPGGPFVDYLIELCTALKAKHPKVFVKTLAYRRAQMQKPPTLPKGERLPENLIIEFAPIEDNYFADWTHSDPAIQETYEDLKTWGKITTHLWAWYYPNPWGSGAMMPVGNIHRLVTNLKLMHQAGVTGLFIDHNGLQQRAGLSELQTYLLYKLMQDIHRDPDALIEEFTDNMVGPAAPLMRDYLKELEDGRRAMTKLPPGPITYISHEYNEATFPYLTVENIHRWQEYFNQMETKLEGYPERELINVRLMRRELDLATLWKWLDLKKAYPEAYEDYDSIVKRVEWANTAHPSPPQAWEKIQINRNWHTHPMGNDLMADYINVIKAGGKTAPLPKEFDGIDPARIKTFLPQRYRGGVGSVLDPDAAFGYATPVDQPDVPFAYGFHQMDTKTRIHTHNLGRKQVSPGQYRLYPVGKATVTPESWVYFGKSWETRLDVGARLHEPGAENLWEVYVSMKFEGPTYGGKEDEDRVLVDRVILVSLSDDQFSTPLKSQK